MMPAVAGVLGQQLGGGGGAPTTVYVEEDFTATTTGDLTTNNLAVDEVGNGWQGSSTSFDYNASGEGVECTTTNAIQRVAVETSGREDVQVTMTAVITKGSQDIYWQGVLLRGPGGGSAPTTAGSLCAWFTGSGTDVNLDLHDGRPADTLLHTWDLSALLTTQPETGDTVTLVMRCSGDDVTLYSIQVNGGTVETVNDTYTLTGTPATDHGASSGADWYGMLSNERQASSTERFEYFKVESIPG